MDIEKEMDIYDAIRMARQEIGGAYYILAMA